MGRPCFTASYSVLGANAIPPSPSRPSPPASSTRTLRHGFLASHEDPPPPWPGLRPTIPPRLLILIYSTYMTLTALTSPIRLVSRVNHWLPPPLFTPPAHYYLYPERVHPTQREKETKSMSAPRKRRSSTSRQRHLSWRRRPVIHAYTPLCLEYQGGRSKQGFQPYYALFYPHHRPPPSPRPST